ncbi:Hypoxia induced protein conserved region [Musa troglodytarum]|uniref:Hypoxia induced protein conserved region n=1 Tax=Musa troglodytarum TaxID=320322 RepID=A0A9E7GMF0_9LILI|nr:Hypoxia induced protein conserved region [Musa troglodytarum]
MLLLRFGSHSLVRRLKEAVLSERTCPRGGTARRLTWAHHRQPQLERGARCLWLGGIGSSIAYNWSQSNMKPSVKIIHARLHAQARTLAALAGAAVVEYYDQYQSKSGGAKAN